MEASDAAPSGRASAADQLAGMAAAVARFEAEVAPHLAAEAQPEASLEALRLRTPTLRPVGCWSRGCAPLTPTVLPRMQHCRSGACCRRCPAFSTRGACAGAATCPARRRHLRTLLCSGCNAARYCSAACQKAAWRAGHKGACQRLQQARA